MDILLLRIWCQTDATLLWQTPRKLLGVVNVEWFVRSEEHLCINLHISVRTTSGVYVIAANRSMFPINDPCERVRDAARRRRRGSLDMPWSFSHFSHEFHPMITRLAISNKRSNPISSSYSYLVNRASCVSLLEILKL